MKNKKILVVVLEILLKANSVSKKSSDDCAYCNIHV